MPKKRPTTLPADLKRIRHAAGLTQDQLAIRAGSSRTGICKIEAGKKEIGRRLLEKLADACDHNYTYNGKRYVFTPR